jgi:ABC-type proline/glycine betaine transport system substrate-binding protein
MNMGVVRFVVLSIAILLMTGPMLQIEGWAAENSTGRNLQKLGTLPGDGKQVRMARADWDTGWFQTEIFKLLLEELGYDVSDPVTMGSWDFYLSAARGDKDLWVNGWFPSNFFEDERVRGKLEAVGYEVKAGALQGYLIDRASADKYGISNLQDFERPEIARIFDRDGNGKAELIGCNIGWYCKVVIEHHLEEYGLNQTVEVLAGDYSPLIAETIKRYKHGQPVFFYTWTPNWVIGKLIPGKDVIWLQVPFPSLPEGKQVLEAESLVTGVTGCKDNPCSMGFPPSDIRVVANKDFLHNNPAVRRLAESVVIPLDDINAQNARMIDGEDDDDDIQRHAREWIHRNLSMVETWLIKANQGKLPKKEQRSFAVNAPINDKDIRIRVVTKRLEPYVVYQNRHYTGFAVDLWNKIALEMGVPFELYGVNTIAKLLDEVKRGNAHVAIGGIGITSKREQSLDFSHAFFESGLQIMVPQEFDTYIGNIFFKVLSILISPALLYIVGVFLIVLLIVAHIIWLLERRGNPQFSKNYFTGLWQSIWWAVVTVTTVGYGDKTPKGRMGRFFALMWILVGYFVFAYFTASVTTTITVQELKGTIDGPEDLFGKKLATVAGSPASEYLASQGLLTQAVDEIDIAYHLLKKGEIDAIVYDAPVLQHYASRDGKGKVKVVGLFFEEQSYGFALPVGSPYRERINVALLKLIEKGIYKEIHDKWFGA